MTSLSSMPGGTYIHGWFQDALSKYRIDVRDLYAGYWHSKYPFDKCTDIRIERIALATIRSQIDYHGPITYWSKPHYVDSILADITEEQQRTRYESVFSSFRFTLHASGDSQLYGKTFSKVLVFCGGLDGFDQENDLLSLLKYLDQQIVPVICSSKKAMIRRRSTVPIGPYTLTGSGVEFVKKGLFGTKEVTIPYREIQVNAGTDSVWVSAQGHPTGPHLQMSELNSLVFESLINSLK